jgi:large-conductance mechanosensitive channel
MKYRRFIVLLTAMVLFTTTPMVFFVTADVSILHSHPHTWAAVGLGKPVIAWIVVVLTTAAIFIIADLIGEYRARQKREGVTKEPDEHE